MNNSKFRRPSGKKLIGTRGVGSKIRHREIVKAIDRLKHRLGESFIDCKPIDVWKECLRIHKIMFDGDYYGSGNTPRPSRSQATMMSMRLSYAKENKNGVANALAAATKFLKKVKNEKSALALIESCSELIVLSGGKDRAKIAIKTLAKVKK